MKELLVTKNIEVLKRCIELDILCAIDLNFKIELQEIKSEFPELQVTDMKSKSVCHTSFDKGISKLRSRKYQYAKDLITPKNLYDRLKAHLPVTCEYDGPYDLQHYLPENLRALSCMTYIGASDSGTPFHIDQGGSPGHNCMVFGDKDSYSEWIFIAKKHFGLVSKTLKNFTHENKMIDPCDISCVDSKISKLDQNHINITLEQFENIIITNKKDEVIKYQKHLESSAFKFKQTQGIFVFIPNGTMHQVRNYGLSAKIAWNIVTPSSCDYFITFLLDIYAQQKRPQVYRHCACLMYFIIAFLEDKLEINDLQFIRIRDALKAMDSELSKLYIKIEDGIKFEDLYKKNSNINVGLDLICDNCCGDIYLFSFHCDCQHKSRLNTMHQNILVKENGYDYCIRCFEKLGESGSHCRDIVLHRLLPCEKVHDQFKNACEKFNDLRMKDPFCRLDITPIPRDFESIYVITNDNDLQITLGMKALSRYKKLARKRKAFNVSTFNKNNTIKRKKSKKKVIGPEISFLSMAPISSSAVINEKQTFKNTVDTCDLKSSASSTNFKTVETKTLVERIESEIFDEGEYFASPVKERFDSSIDIEIRLRDMKAGTDSEDCKKNNIPVSKDWKSEEVHFPDISMPGQADSFTIDLLKYPKIKCLYSSESE
eukprot:NODE_118_length_18285_cov_1.016606.p4 type:complete len:656 gc:universal NODE_118_length_18285_cov_1.016606:3475-1508(-)